MSRSPRQPWWLLVSMVLPAVSACSSPPPAAPPRAAPAAPPSQPLPAPEITMLAPLEPQGPVPQTPFAGAGITASPGQTLADWVEPPFSVEGGFMSPHVVATGRRAAVLHRGPALYVTHSDRGVAGPVASPEGAFWIGLDGQDTLFAARPDGTLFRLRDLARVRDPAAFEPIARIPAAVTWDATAGLVVAAGGPYVFSSIDGGGSFRYAALPNGVVAAQIAARDDGVIVVVAHEGGDARRSIALISRDHGLKFSRSSFQPRSLHREGARISGRRAECNPVLSTNGETWAGDEPQGDFRLRTPWEHTLSVQEAPAGVVPENVQSVHLPTAPPVPRQEKRVGKDGRCPVEPSGRGERSALGGIGALQTGTGAGGFGALGNDEGILGIARSLPPSSRPSRTRWGFLGDGSCHPSNAISDARDQPLVCRRDRPLFRMPRLARVDDHDDTLEILDAPAGCAPSRFLSARGAGVLVCAPDAQGRTIYVAGRDGRFYPGGSIRCDSDDLRVLGARDDGTFALTCGAVGLPGFSFWVRKPGPLGAAEALRRVDIPDAIAYRLLDGGRVVVVTTRGKPAPKPTLGGLGSFVRKDAKPPEKPKKPETPVPPPPPAPPPRERHVFSIVLDEPGGQKPLARDLFVADDVKALGTMGNDVFVRVEDKGGRARYQKLDHGQLRDVSAAEAPAEIQPATPRPPPLPHRITFAIEAPHALAADATHLYFADMEGRRVLRVPRAGGPEEVLASDQPAPLAVAVDEERVYFTTIGSSYGDPGGVFFVAKSGGPVTALAGGRLRPVAVAAIGDAVYWLEQGLLGGATGALYRSSKRGGRAALLLSRLVMPRSLAFDSAHVYVGQGSGDVLRVPLAGGAAARIGGRGDAISALLVSDESVIMSPESEALLARVPRAGGAISVVERTPFHSSALAVQGGDLWMTGNVAGKVARRSQGSHQAEVVIEDLEGPSAVFVDETSIYVRELDGARVRRLPRNGGRGVVLYERPAR